MAVIGGLGVFGGHYLVGARQRIAAGSQFDGATPKNVATVLTPCLYSNSVVSWADPANPSVVEGTVGGLFTFGESTLEITTILAYFGAAADIRVTLVDPDGSSNPIIVTDWTAAVSARFTYSPPLVILPNHCIKIESRVGVAAKSVTILTSRATKTI